MRGESVDMPVLEAGQDLPPYAARVCAATAWRVQQGLRDYLPSVGLEDLRQQAFLIGWTYLREHEHDGSEHGYPASLLGAHVRRRLIDYLRMVGFKRGQGVHFVGSIDEELRLGGHDRRSTTLAEILPDPLAEHAYDAAEDSDALSRALELYSGPAWHCEVALLRSHGASFTEIGAHYGITESRACQVWTTFVKQARYRWFAEEPEDGVAEPRGDADSSAA